tara:strand:- start:10267 stop:12507 length:2241 start_codon:yes stop_codon:yes gene_type:complete
MYRDFWEAKYRIFGLHTIKNGKCGCGNDDCKAIGKHPLASNWQHTPLWDDEQIETMEVADQFITGYGVLVRGLLVIDVDARNGGVISYERLKSDFPVIEKAGLIVSTGSGGGSKHVYFSVPDDLALVQKHADYPGIDFKSSGYVVGPESLHISGARYTVEYGSPEDIDAAPDGLISLLKKPDRHRAEIAGQPVDVSHADIAEMLEVINPDSDHETWVRCGMAVHHASAGTAFAVWDKWSAQGSKYPGSDVLSKRWHSFGKAANPVTLGTLTHYAETNGWKQSVTFEAELPADVGLDITNVNLKRPPGFVGLVTEWIEDQCRRPREHLSVAGALTAIGNIVGLKYTDDLDSITSNLFSFCVAGSATGKDSILSAVTEIHLAAGIHPATHGSIKSEQEIIRNLVDHQASFYAIDEIGIFLGKVKNAQAKGGAPYLDGIIGVLMSIYSKANGYLLLTGDMKKEVRKAMRAECVQIEKQIEEEPSPALDKKLAEIKVQMQNLSHGLTKPFLSLIGFTTNVTFDSLVDFQNATNGFVGRSVLFTEWNTSPARKRNFRARKMPDSLRYALAQLYSGDSYDSVADRRIENYSDRIKIPTTPGAAELLEKVADIFDEMAEDHKSKTGLEAIALRAYEQVAKVSLILAVPEGLRTEEHVRWSYALIIRDIKQKMDLVTGNERAKDDPGSALQAKLRNMIRDEDGETLGVIVNRLRQYKKADIERCLNEMIRVGSAVVIESQHKYNKAMVKRYRGA